MNRRKFLTGGGAVGLLAAVTGGSSLSGVDESDDEKIPHFKDGEMLTSEQLNRLVDEVNRLKEK